LLKSILYTSGKSATTYDLRTEIWIGFESVNVCALLSDDYSVFTVAVMYSETRFYSVRKSRLLMNFQLKVVKLNVSNNCSRELSHLWNISLSSSSL